MLIPGIAVTRVLTGLPVMCVCLFLVGCSHLTDGLRYPETVVATPIDSVRNLPGSPRQPRSQEVFGDDSVASTGAYNPGTDQFTNQANGASWQPRSGTTIDGMASLSLVNASIDDAAKAVIGDILKSGYVIDPAVTGTVTIDTGKPLPVATIVAIFEEALRGRGATLVQADGFYKIVPNGAVLSAGIDVSTASVAGGSNNAGPGQQVRVMPLTHISAIEMGEILKSMTRPEAIRRIDNERNLIIVSGNAAELSTIQQTVQIFDADWLKGKSFGLFRLDYANPADVVKELETVFSTGKEGSARGLVTFIPNKSLSSVLVVSPRRQYVDRAGAWIRRLDAVGSAQDRRLYSYQIQNRPARELADILQKIYAGANGRNGQPTVRASVAAAAPEQGVATEGAGASTTEPLATATDGGAADASGATDAPQLTDAGALPADSPSALAAANALASQQPAQDQGGADVSIVADDANNSLLILAKPIDYEKILLTLQNIDAVPSQVLLEATILEVSLTDNLKFGLRWFFESGDNASFKLSDVATGAVAQQFPGFSYFLNADSIKVAINALAAITDVNVISSPSLMVLDNRKATLQVGDEVPIATQQAVGVTSADAPVVNSISFRNTGVLLSVTPRVSDSGRVVLDIEQEVSIPVETTTSGIDSPTIQKRRIRTTVSVLDGESLTLGGLMQERNNLERSQVPLLGDVPVFGNLFKAKDDTIARTELLIIITPKVIRDDHQARAATEEFRNQLDLSLRPAHLGPPGRRENIKRLLVR